MLPQIRKVKRPTLTLPTAWQTVIFRNYGYVPTERIAGVLGCDEPTVHAEAAYLHYLSDLTQTEFALYKRSGDTAAMRECALRERRTAERLLTLMRADSKIGFEASNHYFYTERNLIEKILRMDNFAQLLS